MREDRGGAGNSESRDHRSCFRKLGCEGEEGKGR